MVALTLNLLGQPSVRCSEGKPHTPELSAKALALLTYLTLEPGSHSREELAGLLWGESADAEARGSLRQALKQLRNELGDVVVGDRSALRLGQPIGCDVQDFRRLVTDDPRQAVTAEIPRFLTGFSLRSAPRFEEWVAELRRELLRSYQHALGTLAREAMGQWRWREAAAFAERWLSCDPFSDEAVRLAVEAWYLAGDRGTALGTFAQYRAALQAETGCEPSRTLLDLMQRVEADANPNATRPVTDEWYARAPSFESSLVGREKEWARLVQAWKAARQGTRNIVLIEGETGVGKSRLADEFIRWIVAQGGSTLRGRGYDGRSGVPFEPIVEILRNALVAPGLAGTDPEWLAEVVRLVPELRRRFPGLPDPAPQADSADEWRLFEGAAQVVLAIAAERPLVVLLDDLHWWDGDSCNLVRFVIRRTESAPVLWLVTLTAGELEHDAPAARLSQVLRASPQASVVSLKPLSEEELWRMIHDMGHVSTPSGGRRLAGRLFAASVGNPFYAIELLKTMFAQGLLSVDGDTRSWTAPSTLNKERREFPISESVHNVIAERVERLPQPLRDVLVTLAVSGSPCSAEVLSQIHETTGMHAAALGDALVERRLVADVGGAYRCVHPIVGRVVRDRLTASRLQEVHRALATTQASMSRSGKTSAVSGEIARHADQAGETALAYRFALTAVTDAVHRYAYREASSWLEVAGRNARGEAEAEEVKRAGVRVLDAAGVGQAPTGEKLGGPITKGLEPEDFDLPVK